MQISDRKIGPDERPYVIAEMSGNHNQSLERALEIVDAAALNGADAIKLQTYTADTMTLDVRMPGFVIDDPKSLWAGRQLYELYQEAYTPWEWHKPIMERAAAHGMHCFSSPFDATAVDFLESLGVAAYKIASFEIIDLPLIRKAASTGKPMIISTGMATAGEIEDAVMAAREAGCRQLMLLKCTSTYPAKAENTNILTIPHMREMFGCQVGLSDHTMGSGVAVASVALGATLIEKHFTLARSDGGVDSAFSMEPDELRRLVEDLENARLALGRISYGATEAERKSLSLRRSLYIAKDVKAGEVLDHTSVRAVRPGHGLSPKFIDFVIGRRVSRDAPAGTPVGWDLLA
ncbi:pseudaminic acid synthase [Brevundimonas sp. FT23042]|uniref:pseudaminic acid synthase n=1 Tax=Brevundimonas sp. FT23042 TaxID=3393749 RepID=UPI003B585D33